MRRNLPPASSRPLGNVAGKAITHEPVRGNQHSPAHQNQAKITATHMHLGSHFGAKWQEYCDDQRKLFLPKLLKTAHFVANASLQIRFYTQNTKNQLLGQKELTYPLKGLIGTFHGFFYTHAN
ncbi:MAG: hypothetical protein KDJ45_00160 [Hyphomicrobiaceae bacterium]|nr:hypothetical protein [Hyphomicrobiaceae bacterium]MCC0009538.1 hypothetical protein [Hyphomicrobiaceae bacterium]